MGGRSEYFNIYSGFGGGGGAGGGAEEEEEEEEEEDTLGEAADTLF